MNASIARLELAVRAARVIGAVIGSSRCQRWPGRMRSLCLEPQIYFLCRGGCATLQCTVGTDCTAAIGIVIPTERSFAPSTTGQPRLLVHFYLSVS